MNEATAIKIYNDASGKFACIDIDKAAKTLDIALYDDNNFNNRTALISFTMKEVLRLQDIIKKQYNERFLEAAVPLGNDITGAYVYIGMNDENTKLLNITLYEDDPLNNEDKQAALISFTLEEVPLLIDVLKKKYSEMEKLK